MYVNKAFNKKVSFREVGDSSYTNINRSNTKKTSILKSKTKNRKKEEEKVQQIDKIPEKKEKIEIKIEQPVNNKCDNKMKQLSTEEYFKLTVQDALEQGLLNMALVHPTNPIKFLGNFLIEKSKHNSAL